MYNLNGNLFRKRFIKEIMFEFNKTLLINNDIANRATKRKYGHHYDVPYM